MDVQKIMLMQHQVRAERLRIVAFLDGIEAELASLIPPDDDYAPKVDASKAVLAVLRRKRMHTVK